eukprot:1533316-Alexandrium_andersonii.AAC.1
MPPLLRREHRAQPACPKPPTGAARSGPRAQKKRTSSSHQLTNPKPPLRLSMCARDASARRMGRVAAQSLLPNRPKEAMTG